MFHWIAKEAAIFFVLVGHGSESEEDCEGERDAGVSNVVFITLSGFAGDLMLGVEFSASCVLRGRQQG